MAQTLGQYLLNEQLPSGMSFSGEVTKKKLYGKLTEVARKHPDIYGDVVQGIKRVGDIASTYEGISVGLDDIEANHGPRNRHMKETLRRVKAAKSDSARQKIIGDAQDAFRKLTIEKPGDMTTMVQSGGRGNVNQYMKAVTSPVAIGSKDGGLEPWLITHSYAEGLRPDELWVANKEARRNAITAKEAVSEPGAFGKIMLANMSGQTVTEHECGTNGGVRTATDDPNLVGRHLAVSAGGQPRNTLITEEVRASLVRKGVKFVVARSPISCESLKGVCRMCYGLDEWNRLPKIGTNLGVRSAQALSEPLTQFALSAKHGVQLAGKKALPGTTGLKGLTNFLEFPRSFMRKAVLANVTGTVSKIEEAPQGGNHVSVRHSGGSEKFYVPPGLDVTVNKGAPVTAGDALSEGIAMPDEVVAHKGLSAGRKHIADTVHGIFTSQGSNVDKRHAELLARGHLSYVRVHEDPSGEHAVGEVVPYDKVRTKFSDRTEKIGVSSAKGKILGGHVLHYGPGTEITKPIAEAIKDAGIKEVPVYPGGFRVKPVVKPLTRNPLLDPDWLSKMSHRYLKRIVQESAAEGAVSSIHGTHPVPGFIYGAAFGEGPGGSY